MYHTGEPGASQLKAVDEADSLRRTNPELVVHTFFQRSNTAIRLDTTKPPFDDIRVRQAMQNALDLETMNLTYYKGQSDWTPRFGVSPAYAAMGMTVPHEEWSPELKAMYALTRSWPSGCWMRPATRAARTASDCGSS